MMEKMDSVDRIHRITDHFENEKVIVRDFSDSKLGSRLMSMGILPGSLLIINKRAPFKGGFCVKTLSGVKFALRYIEAENIIVD